MVDVRHYRWYRVDVLLRRELVLCQVVAPDGDCHTPEHETPSVGACLHR
jgi:hypothetical protein